MELGRRFCGQAINRWLLTEPVTIDLNWNDVVPGERTRPRVQQPAPSPVVWDAHDTTKWFGPSNGGEAVREGADHRRRGARAPRNLNSSDLGV